MIKENITVENVLFQIQTEYSKGINSDSSQLSNRYTYSKALGNRSRLLSQKSKNKQVISDSSHSVFPCIQIVKVRPSECPFVPPTGCYVARSKFPIPKLVSGHNSEIIKRVGSVEPIDGDYVEFIQTDKRNLKYQKGSKFSSSSKKFYIHDGYLYLQAKTIPMFVEMVAVVYDPYEAEKFNQITCGISGCITPYDIDFKIDSELMNSVTLMTAEHILTIFGNLRSNDRNEDNVDENQRQVENGQA